MWDEDGINSFLAKLVLWSLTAYIVTVYSIESYRILLKEKKKYVQNLKNTVDYAYVANSAEGHY